MYLVGNKSFELHYFSHVFVFAVATLHCFRVTLFSANVLSSIDIQISLKKSKIQGCVFQEQRRVSFGLR